MRAPLFELPCASLYQQCLNSIHSGAKILIGPGPARGMNARFPIERVDDQTGIVGERYLAACAHGGDRLDARVGRKGISGFLWLGEAEVISRFCDNAVRREQVAHFLKLAFVMGGDHHRTCEFSAHITAIFWRPTSFAMPLRASASSAAN